VPLIRENPCYSSLAPPTAEKKLATEFTHLQASGGEQLRLAGSKYEQASKNSTRKSSGSYDIGEKEIMAFHADVQSGPARSAQNAFSVKSLLSLLFHVKTLTGLLGHEPMPTYQDTPELDGSTAACRANDPAKAHRHVGARSGHPSHPPVSKSSSNWRGAC
jgi:hypothetical protein